MFHNSPLASGEFVAIFDITLLLEALYIHVYMVLPLCVTAHIFSF